MLDDVDVFAGHLAVTERVAGSLQLRVIDLASGDDHAIAFDEPAYSVHTSGNAEFETATLRFVYTSLTTPASTFDYDLATRERVLRKRQPVPGYDPSLYASERIFAVAADGTEVPISLVYRKDARRDGPQPLLLYGYGSYGIPIDAAFSQSRVSLLDRGVVFAIAHIRGGGDLGRSWYEAGKMARKQTTFDDFIACAEKLIAAGRTTPAHARDRRRQRRRPADGRGRQPAPRAVPRGGRRGAVRRRRDDDARRDDAAHRRRVHRVGQPEDRRAVRLDARLQPVRQPQAGAPIRRCSSAPASTTRRSRTGSRPSTSPGCAR